MENINNAITDDDISKKMLDALTGAQPELISTEEKKRAIQRDISTLPDMYLDRIAAVTIEAGYRSALTQLAGWCELNMKALPDALIDEIYRISRGTD